MESKQIGIVITLLLISIGIIVVSRTLKKGGQKRAYTIGILQTASHPALDSARDGFIKAIEKKMGKEVDFVIRNGQGSINTIHAAAQQFHAKQDIDAVFAIATPAAQAMVMVEKEKPIILAAVTITPESDIFAADNICGVSDMIDVRKEVEAMKAVLPQEAKNIGIIFCSAEINSVTMSKIMVEELQRVGYIPHLCAITSEADVEPAILSAVRKVDALLAPTDNVVASSIALIADIAAKAHKPLIVSDNLLIEHALMARGVDYYQSGQQAGEMAMQIITQNKKPHDIGIVKADNKDIYVNKRILQKLGYTISDSIKDEVVLVGEQLT